jgi:hypothetical protein
MVGILIHMEKSEAPAVRGQDNENVSHAFCIELWELCGLAGVTYSAAVDEKSNCVIEFVWRPLLTQAYPTGSPTQKHYVDDFSLSLLFVKPVPEEIGKMSTSGTIDRRDALQ